MPVDNVAHVDVHRIALVVGVVAAVGIRAAPAAADEIVRAKDVVVVAVVAFAGN